MYRARRTLLVAQVWLTAFMTLLSGAPQLTCVCPDGRVKQFCLSFLPGLAGCCCSHACTPAGGQVRACCCGGRASSLSEPAGERPCCRARRGVAAEKLQSQSQVGCPGCRKTMTPSGVVAVPSPSADQHLAGDIHAHVADFAVPFYAGRSLRTSDARSTQRHPPDDLIVVLQRLVI